MYTFLLWFNININHTQYVLQDLMLKDLKLIQMQLTTVRSLPG